MVDLLAVCNKLFPSTAAIFGYLVRHFGKFPRFNGYTVTRALFLGTFSALLARFTSIFSRGRHFVPLFPQRRHFSAICYNDSQLLNNVYYGCNFAHFFLQWYLFAHQVLQWPQFSTVRAIFIAIYTLGTILYNGGLALQGWWVV